jgi:Spy/CpxP family protein refolding chaperone
MKKLIVLTVLVLSLSNVYADDKANKDRPRHPGFVELDLTADQQVQMKAVREKHQAEKDAMRQKHQADVKSILTEEQWVKFEKSKAERKNKRMQHRKEKQAKSE